MPHMDWGYMEGDDLGKHHDFRVLARLAAYARPHLRLIAMAIGVIVISIGLDLLLPYITRTAIDSYIVRHALVLDLARAPRPAVQKFLAAAGDQVLATRDGARFIPEARWRELDHRVTRPLRRAGALGERPYLMVADHGQARDVAAAHPELFRRAKGYLFISTDDLPRLGPRQLKQLRRPDVAGLIRLALVFVAVSLFIFLCGFAQHMLLERAGQKMMLTIRRNLYQHLLTRSLAFHSNNPVGKLVTRLTNDVQNLNEMYRTTVVALFQDFFLIIGIVVVLLLLDLRLALACMALTPIIAALAWGFARLARDAFRRLQGHLGLINARLSETLGGLAVIKLFRAEKASREQFNRHNQGYFQAGLHQIKVFTVFMPLTELISGAAVALIIWYGGGQVVADRISLGTLVAFISYMQMFFRPVRDLAEKYNILQNALASGERIFHLLDNDQTLPRPARPQPLPRSGAGRVRFERVTFGYHPHQPVLREVDFTIEPGETWAVVGATGAGKSSLVNLLLRLYDPQEGRVLIDGVDLTRVERGELARRVALVDQDVFLLAGTVADNIVLGRDWIDEAHLRQALEVSGARHFVDQLDHGLDTELGEGARRLSAGQRQLLALARALAGHPAVLVLDEATSAVDPESERLIQDALPRVMAGRTSLVVAHRLSTIQHADRILVMSRGRIVEQGTHQQLLAAGGLYTRLVELQEAAAGRNRHVDGY